MRVGMRKERVVGRCIVEVVGGGLGLGRRACYGAYKMLRKEDGRLLDRISSDGC
jgi:hypothetical protein